MVKTAILQPAPVQFRYWFDQVITWSDESTEHVQLGQDGYFRLDGIRKKLVGITSPHEFASGNPWDADNLAIFELQLAYLQSVGVRIIQPWLYFLSWADDSYDVTRYEGILDLCYQYKMLVVPVLQLKGQTAILAAYDNLATADYAISDMTVSTVVAMWVNKVKTYSNVVALAIENELDLPFTTYTYTAANLTTYASLLYSTAKANSSLPILMKFADPLGYSHTASYGTMKAFQTALLPYTDIPCYNQYWSNETGMAAMCNNAQAWFYLQGRLATSMWCTEIGNSTAANMTVAIMNAALATSVAVVFLHGMNHDLAPDWNYVDTSGNPIENMGTLMAQMDTWQASI